MTQQSFLGNMRDCLEGPSVAKTLDDFTIPVEWTELCHRYSLILGGCETSEPPNGTSIEILPCEGAISRTSAQMFPGGQIGVNTAIEDSSPWELLQQHLACGHRWLGGLPQDFIPHEADTKIDAATAETTCRDSTVLSQAKSLFAWR